MNEMLNNANVQAALVALIVVGLNALAVWLKSKTAGSVVEANWCYLQPIVEAVIAQAGEAARKPETGSNTYAIIIAKALAEFGDQYRLFEGKDAPDKVIEAARKELAGAVQRTLGGE